MTSYKITPYIGIDGADADDDQRHPAATRTTTIIGPDPGHVPTRSPCRRSTRAATAPASAQSNAVTPPPPIGARPRRRHQRERRVGLGGGQLDRPQRRRRQPDHRLQGHAVHRHDRADAVSVGARQDQRHGHRPRPTAPPTRSRSPRRTRSASSRVRARPRPSPRATRSSTSATPAMIDSRDAGDVERRREVHARALRARSPGSASTRRPPTPAPTSATCGRASGQLLGVRRRSATSRPRAGRPSASASRSRSTPGRRTWRPTSRPTGTTPTPAAGFSSAVTNGAADALANGTAPNGVYAYDGASGFPTNSVQRRQLLGRRPVHRRRRPGGVSGVTATAAKAGATVTWTAPSSGGPPTSYVVTPYIGSTAQATTTVTGTPPATTANVRGLTPARRTRSACTRPTPTARAGVGRIQRGHPDRRHRAERSHGRRRGHGRRPGPGQLDRPDRRRRQPHHQLQDHAVPRQHRADPGQRAAPTRPPRR